MVMVIGGTHEKRFTYSTRYAPLVSYGNSHGLEKSQAAGLDVPFLVLELIDRKAIKDGSDAKENISVG